MASDPREKYWQERFSDAARTSASENDVNIYTSHGWQARQKAFSRRAARLLAEGVLKAGGKAVDLGCGSGAYCRILHGLGLEVTGTDLCQASLDYAAAHSPAGIRFMHANCLELPFRDGEFDLAVSIGVIQHVTDTPRFLRECLRIIRPGGVFLLMTLNRHTVLEAARAVIPALRPRLDAGEADTVLRRFSRRELRNGFLAAAPGAQVEIAPLFVFPRAAAFLETPAACIGSAGGLTFPAAIDLFAVVRLPGECRI